jgi:hypothetical protein
MQSPMVEAPVFVLEGHDLGIFQSVEHAQNHLEPVDVKAGLNEGYDAQGRRLRITTDGRHTLIELAEDEPSDFSNLEQELRGHLIRLGEQGARDTTCDLRCLVQLAVGHTEQPFSWGRFLRSILSRGKTRS